MSKRYSKEQFDDYKLRVRIDFYIKDSLEPMSLDVYSEEIDSEEIKKYIRGIASEKDVRIDFFSFSTREQVDLIHEFIKEIINE